MIITRNNRLQKVIKCIMIIVCYPQSSLVDENSLRFKPTTLCMLYHGNISVRLSRNSEEKSKFWRNISQLLWKECVEWTNKYNNTIMTIIRLLSAIPTEFISLFIITLTLFLKVDQGWLRHFSFSAIKIFYVSNIWVDKCVYVILLWLISKIMPKQYEQ